MKFDVHQPPREFSPYPGISLRDMGDLYLAEDEQVTVRLAPDRGNDVVRKSWGFYLTNSLDGTLRAQGIKTALVRSGSDLPRLYVLLVDKDKVEEFTSYLAHYSLQLVRWLDEWTESPGR
jgi:hypothetical protein